MKSNLLRLIASAVFVLMCALMAFAQSTTAPISGSVTDQNGAVISGASVIVKNGATGTESKSTTTSNGTYTVPALATGSYTVTIEASGFKKAVVQDVKVDAGVPATVNITLEVGAPTDSVIVQGGAEVLQTQSANVSTTITGRQITELPFTSRDALDLVLLLPGTTTPGRPRTSTINGLPKGALNITLDGVNVQDNTLKSSDGFFTYVRPRIDAIDEVTVSTATPGAESSGEGAVQVKFVTRAGNNDFHGSVYEYHRNPWLNANYWFNNRDNKPLPGYTTAPRDRVLLNQYGFRFGGPLTIPKVFNGKDRAFFFVNYEEYRLPEQTTRTRTILTADAQAGIYKYAGGPAAGVNLYQIAATAGQTSTVDPLVGKLLSDIRQSTTTTGALSNSTDPNFQLFTFTNPGGQKRYFPTLRLDFNLTSKHHLENIWNYQRFNSIIDFLNNVDPAFPGFPNQGSQASHRFSNVTALRSTLTSSLVNEARFGLTGGTSLFFGEVNAGQFANQGGYSVNMNTALGIQNATVTRAPSRRNAPVQNFTDTVNWTRGAHALTFGFSLSQINLWSQSQADGVVRSLTLGMAAADTANGFFTGGATGNFPNATTTQLNQAKALYAVLTGRVTGITGTLGRDENTGQYALNGTFVQRARQRETGLFAQDNWRFRPNLTLTGGIRWEVQYPFVAKNDNYSQTTYAGLFGISGEGNLFKPGTTTGTVTQFTKVSPGDQAYNTQYKNFAPSVGLAWSPNFQNKGLKYVFGSSGQSAFRGGYSIAYNREGMNLILSILGSNPGGTQTAALSTALGNIPSTGILIRNGIPSPTGLPTSPSYPITSTNGNSANGFLPDLKTGYVQSWSFGWQRELTKDTALEIRYVGNHGTKLWRQYNINEINTLAALNGGGTFFDEFKIAQANLIANNAAGGTRAGSFAYFGTADTKPLPIIAGFFNGVPAAQAGNSALYTSANFKNTTFTNLLNPTLPNAITFANTIYGNPATFSANAALAGIPRNFFVANPDVGTNGSFLVDNSGATTYNSLVVELRRRLAKGLLVQGSYAFGKSLTNMFVSSSAVAINYNSLRAPGNDKTVSPFGITHGFKADWIYELPIGKGQALLGGASGWTDRLIGGWAFHGTTRIQSGSPVSFSNVNLVNMTVGDLRGLVKVRKEANQVFYLPQDVIDNTRKAFGTLAGTPDPNAKYIAPANYNNPVAFNGQSGFSRVVIYGPSFARFDLSLVKKTKITERVNFEFRAEFLNAFNNINFLLNDPGSDVTALGVGGTTFGQVTSAYRDTSTTNDPGGRLIQIVGRINF